MLIHYNEFVNWMFVCRNISNTLGLTVHPLLVFLDRILNRLCASANDAPADGNNNSEVIEQLKVDINPATIKLLRDFSLISNSMSCDRLALCAISSFVLTLYCAVAKGHSIEV
jgi:hypothetical protein